MKRVWLQRSKAIAVDTSSFQTLPSPTPISISNILVSSSKMSNQIIFTKTFWKRGSWTKFTKSGFDINKKDTELQPYDIKFVRDEEKFQSYGPRHSHEVKSLKRLRLGSVRKNRVRNTPFIQYLPSLNGFSLILCQTSHFKVVVYLNFEVMPPNGADNRVYQKQTLRNWDFWLKFGFEHFHFVYIYIGLK